VSRTRKLLAAKNLPRDSDLLHDQSRRGRRSHRLVVLLCCCGSGVSPRRICHETSACYTINRAGDGAPTGWWRYSVVVGAASRREEPATRQRLVTRSIAPGTALPQVGGVTLLLWEWRLAAKNLPRTLACYTINRAGDGAPTGCLQSYVVGVLWEHPCRV